MEQELSKYVNTLTKGEKITLVTFGIILDGIFEEVTDNCIVLSSATSQPSKKKQYHLIIPLENIYAWGRKEKKPSKKKDGKAK